MIVRSKVPLRLGLAGGGTDVEPYCSIHGGFVLNATIDLYVYCTIETLNEESIIFDAVDIGKQCHSKLVKEFDCDGILDLHKGVYNFVVKKYNNNKPLALRVTTYSDAPPGSGLGTSSTMVVAMLSAYIELLEIPIGEYDIARIAHEIEREELELLGGKQDQYAAVFGGFNFMEFYDKGRVIVNPLRVRSWILNELESSMVLYYIGDSRSSATIIGEQIENAQNQNAKSLNAMHQVKLEAKTMKEAVLKGDIKAIVKALDRSWAAKKEMAHSISNSKIDKIYDKAIAHGAYSGKISGAGGGGFMFFMVNPLKKHQVVKKLNSMGGFVMNFHFEKYGSKAWKIYE